LAADLVGAVDLLPGFSSAVVALAAAAADLAVVKGVKPVVGASPSFMPLS
jgi:hypothetical protein